MGCVSQFGVADSLIYLMNTYCGIKHFLHFPQNMIFLKSIWCLHQNMHIFPAQIKAQLHQHGHVFQYLQIQAL